MNDKKYWDIYENTEKESRKYKTNLQFKKCSPLAYNAACENNWIDLFVWLKIKHKWTYDTCYDIAKGCKSLSDLQHRYAGAYDRARKEGWLKDYTWLNEEKFIRKWKKSICESISKQYSYRFEFFKGCEQAYRASYKNGWLDDFVWLKKSKHNKKRSQYKHKKWEYDDCMEKSLKYSTKSEFSRKSSGAYSAARKNGWLKDFVWLIDKRINLIHDRIDNVYSYEFIEQNAVYVGRSIKPKERDKQHLFTIDTVSKFAKENNISVPEIKILESNLTILEGAEREGFWLNCYKNDGWFILNKAKTGSIGGLLTGQSKYTKEICIELSMKCSSRTEFHKKYPQAYKVSLQKGWLNEFDWIPEKIQRETKYTKDFCYNEALKYHSRSEFQKNNASVYMMALECGYMDEYDWFDVLWENKWDRESCFNEAKKYNTLKEFMESSAYVYQISLKNEWINDYIWLKRTRKPNGFWNNYDNCYNEAKKYSSISELEHGCCGCYNSAFKNDWLKDYDWFKKSKVKNGFWSNYNNCYNEAKKYTSKKEFRKKAPTCYEYVRKNNWINDYHWIK